jgi:hypothetical protein
VIDAIARSPSPPSLHSQPARQNDMGEWEAAEPGVRRRILEAQGSLMLMEVCSSTPAPPGTCTPTFMSSDVFTPLREDSLKGR